MKYLLATVLLIMSSSVFAGGERGIISELYADADGNIAVKFEGGFPNAEAANKCPNYTGWAGNRAVAPILKSTLLSAKASRSTITLAISGCDGGWLKINAVYVK